jgi:hypothetical protein
LHTCSFARLKACSHSRSDAAAGSAASLLSRAYAAQYAELVNAAIQGHSNLQKSYKVFSSVAQRLHLLAVVLVPKVLAISMMDQPAQQVVAGTVALSMQRASL